MHSRDASPVEADAMSQFEAGLEFLITCQALINTGHQLQFRRGTFGPECNIVPPGSTPHPEAVFAIGSNESIGSALNVALMSLQMK
jgi:hypothetical protein